MRNTGLSNISPPTNLQLLTFLGPKLSADHAETLSGRFRYPTGADQLIYHAHLATLQSLTLNTLVSGLNNDGFF